MANRFRDSFLYILLNKPYGVLCQFSSTEGRDTLARLGPFPGDIYPAGRLDADSEGLVLLTNDGLLKHLLMEPKYAHPRTYLVQVEGVPAAGTLAALRAGVIIEQRRTRPAEIRLLTAEPKLPARPVPIRIRKNVPTSWLSITLREGRNRQVRKMTAAVGHPTLRLIRVAIGSLEIGSLRPGEHRSLSAVEIARLREELRDARPRSSRG